MDDGARTLADAVRVLEREAGRGVRAVACTSHLRASDLRTGAAAERLDRLDAARAALHAAPNATGHDRPALLGGVELMLDEPGLDLSAPRLALGASSCVLVEFPRGASPVGAERELARIRAAGRVPLVAHPERCADMTPALAARWKAAGALLQGDATTFRLAGGGARTARARALLAAGAYDVLASDNHGDDRSLAGARDWLLAHGAAEAAALLTDVNPSRVLAGEAPRPVPPVRVPVTVRGAVETVARALRAALGRGGDPPAASTPPTS